MSKPPTAMQFNVPMDLCETSIVEGMAVLHKTIEDGPVFYYVKTSYSTLIYMMDVCSKYGVPAIVEADYSRDEWSMIGMVARGDDMKKAEIWSPGA